MNRIFVGTDRRMVRAERVLEHSVRKHATCDVEIVWMRSGDEGWNDEWDRGREQGKPYSGQGWATDFTLFRFAIPEQCHYEGRAVYMDVDMLITGDVKELFEMPLHKAATLMSARWDVIVWDCARARGLINMQQLRSGSSMRVVQQQMMAGNYEQSRDPLWDVCDRVVPGMKLLHFTNMRTQPWHPWPECFKYPATHPRPEVQKIWDDYEQEANVA